MKCIKCGRKNKLKQRTANNGLCYNCNHQFAFDPIKMSGKVKFTDSFFAKALRNISTENTLFFTTKQFRYFLNKRVQPDSINHYPGIIIIILSCIFLMILTEYLNSIYSEEIAGLLSLIFIISIISTPLLASVSMKRFGIKPPQLLLFH